MYFWIETIFVVFLISVFLTGLLIPQILNIAFRRKLFDDTDARKVHRGIVPRLGGISFLPSVMCAMSLVVGWCLKNDTAHLNAVLTADNIVACLMLMCSLLLLFLVGIADDLVGVRYSAKFVIQIICAVLILMSGICLKDLHGLIMIEYIPDVFRWLLTGFIIVYILNAINLIDGIDGLASGLSFIALVCYGSVFYIGGLYLYSMIAFATAGTLLTFFYYNVFGKVSRHRKIFMGDTGSLTVGMVLAFLSLEIMDEPMPMVLDDYNSVILAYSPLIVPLFDVVRVFIHRLQRHRNPFLPDRSHIHHKLLALGLSSGTVLSLILTVSVLFIISNVTLSKWININLLLVGDVLIWTLGNILLTRKIRLREKQIEQQLY